MSRDKIAKYLKLSRNIGGVDDSKLSHNIWEIGDLKLSLKGYGINHCFTEIYARPFIPYCLVWRMDLILATESPLTSSHLACQLVGSR